ncbi:MAG TPA: ribosome maturation factor RimM [Actinomycetota bacterium]|nr:ribosome maturation factor RimM [Actinomycetota bacterium]
MSDDPRRFEAGSRLLHEDGRSLVVESTRDHRNRFLVKFEGIDDRSGAEALRGAVYVPAEDARDLEPGEFWEHDLAGLDVVHGLTGDVVGTVARVEEGPAQDLLVVDTPRGERLVPLVGEIVVDVDLSARKVTIEPPEGLL